ncbi:MAG: RraA family protein, partial [Eudoraea sp.]
MKACFLYFSLVFYLFINSTLIAQTMTREQMIEYTSDWTGGRFEDGRPKIPDSYLERAKNISIEEAWGAMRGQGYYNQFEGDWIMIHEDMPMTGRALTAQYMPTRPDINDIITKKGAAEG